jgi:ubiquinone/menaquinone biosynthesis C-methylase UbiE
MTDPTPPVCDYEGSDYQSSFWDQGGREYEDRVEAIALKRLLPPSGRLLLELGAGAGRNTARYAGFEQVVLLDYSRTQLEQAQARLGRSDRYVYVAADVYRLPFIEGTFDAATMIRVLHHMADAPRALAGVHAALQPGATFILEFANKLNLKSLLRYALGRQSWSPFARAPVEFAALNFDFHPAAVRDWLKAAGFALQRTLTVSHFRMAWLKRWVPVGVMVFFDSLLQWTGAFWQLTPSVFIKARAQGEASPAAQRVPLEYFKCPACGGWPLAPGADHLVCPDCKRRWGFQNGIYDFREPVRT